MNLTELQIKNLWLKRYGNNAWVKDCYGAWIYFFDRGRDAKPRKNPEGVIEPCGWELDHIFPEAKGGSDKESNLEFVYGQFNAMKSDNLQYRLNNSTVYKVLKRPFKYGSGIYNTVTKCFIDWFSNH